MAIEIYCASVKRAARLTTVPIRLLMALTLAGLIAVVVTELRTRKLDMTQLEAYWQEDLSWAVSQLRFETARLSLALQESARAAPVDQAPEDVVLRYDMLWSRAALFQSGSVARRLAELDDEAVIAQMQAALLEVEPGMTGAGPYTPERFADRFIALLEPLQRYNARTAEFEELRLLEMQNAVSSNVRTAGVMKIVSTVCLLSLMTLLLLQRHVDRRRLREQRRLTEAAEAAAETRKRFMTMMSHELRTPMNGVLGALGVLEHKLTDPNNRALAQTARKSGMEMVGLLEDILEVAAHETDGIPTMLEPTRLGDLAEAIGRQVAGRSGADVMRIIEVADRGAVVVTDVDGLSASIRHTVAFLTSRLGAKRCRLSLGQTRDQVVATLCAEARAGSWDPQALFGALRAKGDSIGTEAIGAALARAHLRRIGGEGHVKVHENGVVTVVLSAPATRMSTEARPPARVADTTETLATETVADASHWRGAVAAR
jgi:signal transduction histidine kinase